MAEELDSHVHDPVVQFVKELLPSAAIEPDPKQEPLYHSSNLRSQGLRL
jgi:hypothetical protein